MSGQDRRTECEYAVELYYGSRPGWVGLTRAATLDEARGYIRKRIDNGRDSDKFRIVKVTREVVG